MRIQTPLVYVFTARLFPNGLAFTLPFISSPGLPDLTHVSSDVRERSNGSHTWGIGPQRFSHGHQDLIVVGHRVLIVLGLGHRAPTFSDWHIGCSRFSTPRFPSLLPLLRAVGHIFRSRRRRLPHAPGFRTSLRGLCGLLLLLLGF